MPGEVLEDWTESAMKVKRSAAVKTEWTVQICAGSVHTNASYLFAADFISPPFVCNGHTHIHTHPKKKKREHGNSRNRRSCVFSYLSAGRRIEVRHLAAP